MSKRKDFELINDIKEAIERISSYTKDMDYRRFRQEAMIQDAVVRNFEILGEAAKNVSAVLKRKHPEVPWRELAALRNRLIHKYFGVNYDIVWQVIENELSGIAAKVNRIG